ncbi:MAG: site-2 protease family protein [Nitrosopumilales archaeon CG_4_9_14_0_2_um_filter_34_16]|nr:MAG: site-2 protease family protein [Nitrosopumilales archaeon CG_4_9_14_0_2_um_filter_34_16]
MEKSRPKEMEEPSQEDIISLVNSIFLVSDFTKAEFSLEFKIEDKDFKSKFEGLARKLEDMSYVCKLEETDDGIYVIVQKFTLRKQGKIMKSAWTPRILFAIVIGFVMFDGYYRTSFTNSIVDIGEPLEMAVFYTLSVMGILGIHELGHIVAAKIHGLKTTWPYFLPGIPVYGIPTFGAFIQSRGLTINREILYDVAIAGPIAGLIVAIIVSIYGAYTAPVLDQVIADELFAQARLSDWNLGEPLLMTASLAMFGKGELFGQVILMTPFMFAAWIGFLITFLNLLPAWQLDGGHMARTLMGSKLHRYATFGSIGILVLLNYWPMAILILIMSSKNPSASPLDDVSPLSRKRKLSYIGIIGLAILCAPLPSNLLPNLLS